MRFLLFFLFLFHAVEASQVVLITGASKGIGFATAKLLSESGYTVYAGARSKPAECPKNIHFISLDVTDEQSVNTAVKSILDKEGKIDVLINNAGIIYFGSLENVTVKEAQEMFDVNFFGVVRMTQAVLPSMRAQKSGRIIQISSRSGFRPLPQITMYAASKYALEGMSEAMAALLKPWNIHVSCVEPGPVETGMSGLSPYGTHLAPSDDPYAKIFSTTKNSGSQKPEEIAQLVKKIIETDHPVLRYQTTDAIEVQAAKRLVDPTGELNVQELEKVLFP
jgi:NAD(P)-dependent dehydrogenase (short-subunit alcohol dehydrogenase family)